MARSAAHAIVTVCASTHRQSVTGFLARGRACLGMTPRQRESLSGAQAPARCASNARAISAKPAPRSLGVT